MEYIFSCEVCSENYNNQTIIPKVLNCGHSFCLSCITKFKDYLCPKCRAQIQRKNKFPTNYSILNIIDECKAGKNLIPDIACRIQDLREKVNSRYKTMRNDISEISKRQKVLDGDLNMLKSLEAKDLTQESERSEVREQLKKMEKRYEVPSIANSASVSGVNLASNFPLKNSKSNNAFLKEIYQALKNVEKVFTFKYIEMAQKWGQLTIRDNKIIIHSLYLDKPPEGCKTVQFDDLKEASRNNRFDPFIEIAGKNATSHMVIIDLEDNMLCPHFIKLCTGENGPSYRNASYSTFAINAHGDEDFSDFESSLDSWDNLPKRRKPNGAFTSVLSVDINKCLPLDYSKNVSSSIGCFQDEVVLKEKSGDGFELSRVHSNRKLSILGKVVYPYNVLDYVIDDHSSSCKILDCGIAIQL